MPYIKVLIHFIWSTKNRQHLISNDLKPLLLQHIKENSIKKEIFIDTLNCVSDHIHLLVSLGQKLIKTHFEWQDEYIALSVGYSAIDKVRSYILNQDEHHKKETFTEEYEEFLNAHHFERVLAKANT